MDEPLYAHFLRMHPDLFRPYRDQVRKAPVNPRAIPTLLRLQVLASQNSDGNAVVRDVILGPCKTKVLFLKVS